MSHLPFSFSEQTNLPELLFVCLPWALFLFTSPPPVSLCLTEGRTRRQRGKGEGDDKTWSKTITRSGGWYGETHSHAISLITSDREGAEGNGYGHGHFHCSAPLATCPIYAFTKHTNTCIHKGVQSYAFSQIIFFMHTYMQDQNRQLDAEVHTQTNRGTDMAGTVIISGDSARWTETCVQ